MPVAFDTAGFGAVRVDAVRVDLGRLAERSRDLGVGYGCCVVSDSERVTTAPIRLAHRA